MSYTNTEKGFIALIAILILSAMLLGMTLSLAQFGIVTRFTILEMERKHASNALAESCVHYAEIFIAHDSEYTLPSPQKLRVGEATCSLIEVTKSGSAHTIKAQGNVRDAITNLVVEINSENGTLISWREVASF